MHYEPVIGLEIHVQLKTKSKMFCRCDNSGEEQPANATVCPICMGHPGVLPVINQQAVEWAVKAALALHCKVASYSKFDRKNYFYPDLPKGYQISQYDLPIATNGYFDIDIPAIKKQRTSARIGIIRVHLEEDAAKLLHSPDAKWSYVDFNRCGTPLLEIVTAPDICSPLEAKIFLQELRLLMRYLQISEADMEKGHLRCDANISLRQVADSAKDKKWHSQLNPKTEIKNLNSFRAVERALAYEIIRQTKLWESGKPPATSSTWGWDDLKQITESQREKEEAFDYRYFPEPDLPPLKFSHRRGETKENLISVPQIAATLPELPQAKQQRFCAMYQFAPADAKILVDNPALANYAEQVISELKAWLLSLEQIEGTEEEIWKKNKPKIIKLVSGWLISKLLGLLHAKQIEIENCKITPENFAEFITLIYQSKINNPTALKILEEILTTGADPSHILEEKKVGQISDSEKITDFIEQVIRENPDALQSYQAGKKNVLQFLVGQVIKKSGGRASPQLVQKILLKYLKEGKMRKT